MTETVIGHVLGRLNEIGVDDVFGVAGDYAFPVNDAIVEHPPINWVGCCNELNAGYAADGYARPNLPTQEGRALVHHTLGDGEFDLFHKMAEPVVCASAVMTTEHSCGDRTAHRRGA